MSLFQNKYETKNEKIFFLCYKQDNNKNEKHKTGKIIYTHLNEIYLAIDRTNVRLYSTNISCGIKHGQSIM